MKLFGLFKKNKHNANKDITKDEFKILISTIYKLAKFFKDTELDRLSFEFSVFCGVNKKPRNILSTYLFLFGYQYEYIYKYGKSSDLISSDYELFMLYESSMILSIKLNYNKLIEELNNHWVVILSTINLIKLSKDYYSKISQFDNDIVIVSNIIKRIIENHICNNTSYSEPVQEIVDLKKYDKPVSLSSLFKKNFSFHVERYEEWKQGECIASGKISFDIHFMTDNSKIYANIPFASKFNMHESVSFDYICSSILNDRIQYLNASGNSQDSMLPIILHVFIKDSKIDYIRFAMSFPDRLVEFYGYQIG